MATAQGNLAMHRHGSAVLEDRGDGGDMAGASPGLISLGETDGMGWGGIRYDSTRACWPMRSGVGVGGGGSVSREGCQEAMVIAIEASTR